MDMFDGFVFLEEKKKSLIPILCQYDFLSALTAAFSITSWRKNRGAQESCLALNSAMVENTEWGRKTIICFDEHINVDQPRIVLRGREEKRIYTAIDLMYMLMFSSEVSQIAEFDSDEKNSESQVLSWGGASDYFTVFLSEKGFISKGAIEYSKVLQPIGSVFEHSNQQKRFFTKEKFDEKFQKRIDYFSKVAMSFFANHGYDTEGFTINPYMVVNKVFSSYYKHVQFPIVTFDELKREIQL